MLGEYGKVGWDLPEDDEASNAGSSYSQEDRLYRFRFRMEDANGNPLGKGRPVVHRVMFLNEAPFIVHEHSLFNYKGCGHFNCLCLKKNNLGDCPICDIGGKGNYPSVVGMFGIIDFGQIEYLSNDISLHHRTWEDKDGNTIEDAFPRVVLAAKKGTDESPGVLKKLLWASEQHGGNLEGTVWDTSRSGRKEAAVGETWNYVERVSPEDYVIYLEKYGADPDKLTVEPIDNWREICRPLSHEKMCRITGTKTRSARTEGAGFGSGPPGDDDIPF